MGYERKNKKIPFPFGSRLRLCSRPCQAHGSFTVQGPRASTSPVNVISHNSLFANNLFAVSAHPYYGGGARGPVVVIGGSSVPRSSREPFNPTPRVATSGHPGIANTDELNGQYRRILSSYGADSALNAGRNGIYGPCIRVASPDERVSRNLASPFLPRPAPSPIMRPG
jgi:hypothetical protein